MPPAPPQIRVLLLHPDRDARASVAGILRSRGMGVRASDEWSDAVQAITRADVDVLVVDLDLRSLPGLEVIRTLRARSTHPPILAISSRKGPGALVEALSAGADDYMAVPLGSDELAARVRALDRRARHNLQASADVRLDPLRSTITIRGVEVRLTQMELRIVQVLVAARGGFVTRDHLLRTVWDIEFDPRTNILYTQISNLRRKLEDHGLEGTLTSERGSGYRLDLG